MEAEILISPVTGDRTLILTLTELDLVRAPLDPWDQLVIRDCEQGGSTSDMLMAAQIIAFRLEQLAASKEAERVST